MPPSENLIRHFDDAVANLLVALPPVAAQVQYLDPLPSTEGSTFHVDARYM